MLGKISRFIVMITLMGYALVTSGGEPLPIKQAFHTGASVTNPNGVRVQWQMPPGYFLYQQRLKFSNLTTQSLQLGAINLPTATLKKDSDTGPYPVYYDQLDLVIPVLGLKSGTSLVTVGYQGCSDSGFCYPPQLLQLAITIDKSLAAIAVATQSAYATQPSSSLGTFADLLQNSHLGLILGAFFLYGLVLAFYPCNYPLLPILSGLIIGQKKLSVQRTFLLSFSYVLGLAGAYSLIGIAAALIGSNLQANLQHPAVIITASAMFVILALAMFDWFELRLPNRLQNYFNRHAKQPRGGAFLGVLFMGFVSALVITPCATPPLTAALLFVAHKGSVWLGAAALFALGFGTGIPLLLLVTGGAPLLPKAGRWMTVLLRAFGVVFLGVAIYLLSRIIPGEIALVLWAALLSTTAILMGAFKHTNQLFYVATRGITLLMLLYSGILIIGASTGNNDPLHPLQTLLPGTVKVYAAFQPVKSIADTEKAIALATQENKPVLLDFYADWCIACKVIDRTLFSDATVVEELKKYVLLRVDVTANDDIDQALLAHYNVITPPTLLFFDSRGKELPNAKIVGEISQKEFLGHLRALYN